MTKTIREYQLDIALLWIRVLGGLGIMTHGYGKIFGGRMDGFIGGVGDMGFPLPEFFGWMAALSEFVGGWMLVFGFGTRIAAAFIMGTMFVAFFIRHAGDPFNVREKSMLYFTIATTTEILGGGRFSVDYLIVKWWGRRKDTN